MNIVHDPWRVRSSDLPGMSEIYPPRRTAPFIEPRSASEADLFEATWQNRRLETTPPLVTAYPTGMWALGTFGYLYQLRDVPLDQTLPAEQTYAAPVEKYLAWFRAGHQPPPGRGYERKDGRICITDGHHRRRMLERAQAPSMRLWVLAFRRGVNGVNDPTHEGAVVHAIGEELPVPLPVIAEYERTQLAYRAVLNFFRRPRLGC